MRDITPRSAGEFLSMETSHNSESAAAEADRLKEEVRSMMFLVSEGRERRLEESLDALPLEKLREMVQDTKETLAEMSRDAADICEVADLVEEHLDALSRRAISGEDVSDDWAALVKTGPLRFLSYLLSQNRERANLTIAALNAPDEAKDQLRRWRTRYDFLRQARARAEAVDAGLVNTWTNLARQMRYDFERNVPQCRLEIESYGQSVFVMVEDVDDVLKLGRALLQCVSEALDHCDEKNLRVADAFVDTIAEVTKECEEFLDQFRQFCEQRRPGEAAGEDEPVQTEEEQAV